MPSLTSPPLATGWPTTWIVSDARNDDRLEAALAALPRGTGGLIFRHYHLPPAERRARFLTLAAAARRRGHLAVLSGSAAEARRWGADGAYGAPGQLAAGAALLRLATVHSLRELAAALRTRADIVLISPVFPTRSHPGAAVLGVVRLRLLAARARLPVIALGGMDARRARRTGAAGWAAIDGIGRTSRRRNAKDS